MFLSATIKILCLPFRKLRYHVRTHSSNIIVRKDHFTALIILAAVIALFSGMLLPQKRTTAEFQAWMAASYHRSADADMVLPIPQSRDTESVLSQRLGILCARVARLEALGSEISSIAGLDDAEFDFVARDCQQGGIQPSLPLLKSAIDHIDTQMGAMLTIVADRRHARRSWPSGNPLYGASTANITSRYGYRKSIGASNTGGREKSFHRGLDLAAAYGSAVLAMASGVVTYSGKNGRYGNLVEIDHGNGFVTRYGHNSEIMVAEGVMVKRGEMIARVGSTGRSTGPHVHIELLSHGKQIDPELLLNLPSPASTSQLAG